MEKLDRLGWAAGVSFTSFGVRIGVRTTEPEVLSEIESVLPPGAKPTRSSAVSHMFSLVAGGSSKTKGVRRMWILYDAWVREARAREPEPVLAALESAIRMKVAEKSPNKVFVHAGAVSWKGRAIIVPGRSFSGKTTLVAELVKLGAVYYSDEYAVLDKKGRVHPFASPLSMREPGEYLATGRSASSMGAATGSKPIPVALVVLSSFKEGAGWRPRSLSPAAGALEILANTVPARTRPGASLEAIKNAVRDASVIKGVRGEASEVAADLIRRLEG